MAPRYSVFPPVTQLRCRRPEGAVLRAHPVEHLRGAEGYVLRGAELSLGLRLRRIGSGCSCVVRLDIRHNSFGPTRASPYPWGGQSRSWLHRLLPGPRLSKWGEEANVLASTSARLTS